MANGDGKISLIERAVSLGQRAGYYGLAGLLFLTVREVVRCISHFTLDQFGESCGYVGLYLVLFGILSNTKRLKDMTVTVGAEAKIDRAKVMDTVRRALPDNASGPTITASADASINAEIKKQLNGH